LKKILTIVIIGLLLGQILYAQDSQYIERYNFYFFSDTHFQTPFAGLDTGRDRLGEFFREYVNKDPYAAFIVNAGDWVWPGGAAAENHSQRLVDIFTDTLTVPVLPIVGNHEDDIGYVDGGVFNDFIQNFWPEWFDIYVDQDNQGKTWYWYRPKLNGKPINMFFLALNNVTGEAYTYDEIYSNSDGNPVAVTTRHYGNENPVGYGWADYDWAGIRDRDSYQRQYIRTSLDYIEERDWIVVGQHREVRYTGAIYKRFPVVGAQDSGYIWEILQNTNKAPIMFQGDSHTMTWWDLEDGYYTFAGSWAARAQDYEVIHRTAKDPLMYYYGIANGESEFTHNRIKSQTGILETLSVDPLDWPEFWTPITKFEVYGTEMLVKLLIIETGSEANPTVADSVWISQCSCANKN
jgi:hypothetical protein